MNSWTTALKQECAEALVPPAVHVWLFGSCLRTGSPGDIDLLVVSDEPRPVVARVKADLATRLSARFGLVVDFVTLSRDEDRSVMFSLREAAVRVWP